MTDIAACLGIAQLKKADYFLRRREEIAAQYNKAFKPLPQINIPVVKDDIQHSWHLYVIKLNLDLLSIDRKQFIEELGRKGIGTSVHFIPLHIHPYYRETYGYKPEDFPVAYETFKTIVTLPIYPRMSDEDVDRVINSVCEVISSHSK
jgi:dTDP-4-amino-4,6-dideoxygalactose transaminase